MSDVIFVHFHKDLGDEVKSRMESIKNFKQRKTICISRHPINNYLHKHSHPSPSFQIFLESLLGVGVLRDEGEALQTLGESAPWSGPSHAMQET